MSVPVEDPATWRQSPNTGVEDLARGAVDPSCEMRNWTREFKIHIAHVRLGAQVVPRTGDPDLARASRLDGSGLERDGLRGSERGRRRARPLPACMAKGKAGFRGHWPKATPAMPDRTSVTQARSWPGHAHAPWAPDEPGMLSPEAVHACRHGSVRTAGKPNLRRGRQRADVRRLWKELATQRSA